MELEEDSFLNELMALRREVGAASAGWQSFPTGGLMTDLIFCGGGDCGARGMDVSPFQDMPMPPPLPPPPPPPPSPHEEINFDCLSEVCNPYRNGVIVPREAAAQMVAPLHEAIVEEDMDGKVHHGGGVGDCGGSPTFMFGGGAGSSSEMAMRTSAGAHPRSKLHGAPSKNLMAERRRRKRLNDRLSMLRSIVPKISKMDRTSILGDTIDYVKELTERIKALEKEIGASPEELNVLNTLKDSPDDGNEVLVRNSTKFDVERRDNGSTRIEIRCPSNPGVLLSTVSALEALGLEIEQCVVSCFGDFGMQACLQDGEKRQVISTEEIKQALFRSAGYGGRCL